MYKNLRVTVVIPCLNEEQGIQKVLDEVPSFVDEIIVVDNGSTDRTAEIARKMGARVVSELHRGYGRAYKKGFSQATGDIIITLDGDHSYPVDALSYLIEAFMHCRVGFLSASRFPVLSDSAMSTKHKIGNHILSFVMSILFLRWIHDSQSGMWVFRRNVLEKMKLTSDGMAFSEEIKIEAITKKEIGFREIFISYSQRLGEIKLMPWRDGFHNLVFLFRKRIGV
jgi:glycosyltransferase involved in cell wall biosynthesis